MGDRANIKVLQDEDDGAAVYLYTHWDGYKLKEILKDALTRGRNRWDDTPYLTRIIFSEMIKNDVMGETGYGISTHLTDNERPILTVDTNNQTVSIGEDVGYSFDEFIK